jgi:hypothetical protein
MGGFDGLLPKDIFAESKTFFDSLKRFLINLKLAPGALKTRPA